MKTNRLLKADFHIHTRYSMDCNTSLKELIERCQILGINCIAVADHGTTEGAIEMQKLAPFTVIVAEEILTPDGEIMGMFLKETIPSGVSVSEAISQIRAQDGLVCIPHPFDTIRGSALGGKIVEEITKQIDVLEVLNARCVFQASTEKAFKFARKHSITQSAGSDAHTLLEIGNAHVEMPEFTGKDDFLQALRQGEICGHRSNPLVHVSSVWNKLQTRISRPH